MQAAVPVGVGAMAVLHRARSRHARAVAEEAAQGEVCDVANDNEPGQVVVSGPQRRGRRARSRSPRTTGAKRAVLLPVSAPFHCPLMQPAADAMAKALADAALAAPLVPLFANVTAAPVERPDDDPRAAGRAGDRHGALARKRPGDDRRPASTRSSSSAARCSARWSSASRRTRRPTQRGDDGRHRSAGEGDCREPMFDLTGMTALVTGASRRASARRSRGRWRRRARGSRCRGRAREAARLRRRAGRRSVALPCDLSDGAAVDALVPRGGRGARRQARHPRQQCRRHARQSGDADEGRGVGRRSSASISRRRSA